MDKIDFTYQIEYTTSIEKVNRRYVDGFFVYGLYTQGFIFESNNNRLSMQQA